MEKKLIGKAALGSRGIGAAHSQAFGGKRGFSHSASLEKAMQFVKEIEEPCLRNYAGLSRRAN